MRDVKMDILINNPNINFYHSLFYKTAWTEYFRDIVKQSFAISDNIVIYHINANSNV